MAVWTVDKTVVSMDTTSVGSSAAEMVCNWAVLMVGIAAGDSVDSKVFKMVDVNVEENQQKADWMAASMAASQVAKMVSMMVAYLVGWTVDRLADMKVGQMAATRVA